MDVCIHVYRDVKQTVVVNSTVKKSCWSLVNRIQPEGTRLCKVENTCTCRPNGGLEYNMFEDRKSIIMQITPHMCDVVEFPSIGNLTISSVFFYE